MGKDLSKIEKLRNEIKILDEKIKNLTQQLEELKLDSDSSISVDEIVKGIKEKL
jgi:hypothetical protein|nr:MAG TPA: hypothetical protein [Caudoviricetes sp.]